MPETWFTANQPEGLVVVTQLQPVSLMFTLPQRDLPEALRAPHEAGCRHPPENPSGG